MASFILRLLIAVSALAASNLSKEDEAIIKDLEFFENYQMIQEGKTDEPEDFSWPWDLDDEDSGEKI
jgi:hypothetical protein